MIGSYRDFNERIPCSRSKSCLLLRSGWAIKQTETGVLAHWPEDEKVAEKDGWGVFARLYVPPLTWWGEGSWNMGLLMKGILNGIMTCLHSMRYIRPC
jgi:hypothetical protein